MTNQAYRYSSRRIAGKALETDCQSRENLATLSGVLAYKALHQKRPNQMLLQPPGTYAHYGQGLPHTPQHRTFVRTPPVPLPPDCISLHSLPTHSPLAYYILCILYSK